MTATDTTTKKKPAPETALTNVTTGAVAPAFLAEAAERDAGKGVSTAAEDNIIPLVYVLQANSPQCNKRGPEYVEGAVDGAIWLRGSGRPAIDGDVGILVQPCYFFRNFIEWRLPRGNGIAAVHQTMPADAVEKPNPENPKKTLLMLPNGNHVVEVRNHIVRVFLPDGTVLPYSIPFSSTGHTVSRGWMNLLNNKHLFAMTHTEP